MTCDELYTQRMTELRAELDLTKRQLDTALRLLGKQIEKRNQQRLVEDPCLGKLQPGRIVVSCQSKN
jgi:hypothetical protein